MLLTRNHRKRNQGVFQTSLHRSARYLLGKPGGYLGITRECGNLTYPGGGGGIPGGKAIGAPGGLKPGGPPGIPGIPGGKPIPLPIPGGIAPT